MPLRPKSYSELQTQLEHAETALGRRDLLLPPSFEREELFSLSPAQLKERFPARYQAYVDLVRVSNAPQPPFHGASDHLKHHQTLDSSKKYFLNSKQQLSSFLSVLNGLDGYIQEHQTLKETGEAVLREGQITAFEAIRQGLEQGNTEGYVELPTGFGKTVIFSQLVEATRARTIICVPTRQLVDQTYDKLKAFTPDSEVGRVYTHAKERDSRVIVTTYESLLNDLKHKRLDPHTIELLILDEAHKGLSEARQKAIGSFDHAIKIGFTATPDYDEQKALDMLLPTEYASVDTKSAIEQGYLANCRALIVKTAVDLSGVQLKGDDYDEKALEQALNVTGRNKAAVDFYGQAFVGTPAIAFCVTVKHAEDVAKAGVYGGCRFG
jgi:superfamily II DNA or RNA helicase